MAPAANVRIEAGKRRTVADAYARMKTRGPTTESELASLMDSISVEASRDVATATEARTRPADAATFGHALPSPCSLLLDSGSLSDGEAEVT